MAEQERSDVEYGADLRDSLRNYSQEDRRAFLLRHREQLVESVSEAARHGDLPLLQFFINCLTEEERYATLRTTGKDGNTPLHHTLVLSCSQDVLRYILAAVPSHRRLQLATERNYQSDTPIHTPSKFGMIDMVLFLLGHFNPNERFQIIAQTDRNRRTVLQVSKDLNFRLTVAGKSSYSDKGALIPLPPMHAFDSFIPRLIMAQLPVVQKSSRTSASSPHVTVEFSASRVQHRNQTPQGQQEVVSDIQALRQHLAEVLECIHIADEPRLLLHQRFIDPQTKMTVLHQAVKMQDQDSIMQILSVAGRDPDVLRDILTHPCREEKTALHYAAANNDQRSVLSLLCRAGDLERTLIDATDTYNRKAKCYTSRGSDVSMLLKLSSSYYWRLFITKPTALVFYNTFAGVEEISTRTAAEAEKKDIVRALLAQGMSPRVYKDVPASVVKESIRGCSVDKFLSCLVVVMMSHGDKEIILDGEANRIPISLITSWMSELDPHIPKVLIMQCCLGMKEPQLTADAKYYRLKMNQSKDSVSPAMELDDGLPGIHAASTKVKSRNFVLIHSTLHNTQSNAHYFLRWFSQVMIDCAKKPCKRYDLHRMFQKTQKLMLYQPAQYIDTLEKKLVFLDPRPSMKQEHGRQRTVLSKLLPFICLTGLH